jgi:beta-glucanase (GH16 family)
MARYPAVMLELLLAAAIQDSTLSANNYSVDMPMPAHSQVLRWSDEFNGTALDQSKWSYDTSRNKEGWYNEELQYYAAKRPENLRVGDGILTIELRKDPQQISKFAEWGKQEYSSAKIVTEGKAAFTYGFFEARAKVPCSRGSWPAFWMMPVADVPWPEGGEIDVLEHVGSQPNVVHANLHTKQFNHTKGNGRGAQRPLPTSCSAFHRYQLSWTADEILIGVDDRAYMRVRNDRPGGRGAWPFDQPFYLILNLAMGGGWAGAKGIDDAALPQKFEVDYVRVWDMPEVSAAPLAPAAPAGAPERG